MQAIWNGKIIATSADTVIVEGNHYFPVDSVNMALLKPSDTHTSCPWKGEASYYTIEVDGKLNIDAAWYYPQPKEAASNIQGRVAFWKGVEIRG
jgi:uncharacterized protein (DUF427 family)